VTHARRALGTSGEELVAGWYEARGYRVLARNWRCPRGELDIVVGRGALVVFCEVKTRTSDAFGVPAEAVTRTKQARLRKLGAQWLEEAGGRGVGDVRFDVASVLAGDVEVIEAAF
jgi:putative endonuclease